jgi:acyl-CoA thioesterase
MALGDLDQALKLSRSGEEVWTAHADPNYESMNGMFGGWTAAVALRAVCDEADGKAAPSALTVNFVGKVEPGSDVLIRTRRVGGGRFVSYWQSEVTLNEVTLATASVVLTERRDTRTP